MFKDLLDLLLARCGVISNQTRRIEYTESSPSNPYSFVAPVDGYCSVSINCKGFWISAMDSTVVEMQNTDTFNQGCIFPIRKGETYIIHHDSEPDTRFQVYCYRLDNT